MKNQAITINLKMNFQPFIEAMKALEAISSETAAKLAEAAKNLDAAAETDADVIINDEFGL